MTINLRLASKHRQQAEHQAAFSATINTVDAYDENHLLFLPSGVAEFIGVGAGIGAGLGALAGTGIFENEEERKNTSALSRLSKIAGSAALGAGAGTGVQAGIGAAKKRFGRPKPGATQNGAIPQPGASPDQPKFNEPTAPTKKAKTTDPNYRTIDV